MRKRISGAVGVALVALLAGREAGAAGELIVGHVFNDMNGNQVYDAGVDAPVVGTTVVLRRFAPPPGKAYQAFAVTGPDGGFQFPDVLVGATYRLDVPLLKPILATPIAVAEDGTGEPLPGPVPIAEGRPTKVDLPLSPPPLPAFIGFVPANVVFGVVTQHSTMADVGPSSMERIVFDDNGTPKEGVSGNIVPPLRGFTEPVVVVMERTRGGTTETFEASSETGFPPAFTFPGQPLQAGDHVKLSLKPGQAVLAGWQEQMPRITPTEFDYESGAAPIVQFRLRPAYELPGRVFLDACPGDGAFDADDGDVAVGGTTVSLWTLDAPPPAAPLAETTAAADGTYAFHALLPGLYLVGTSQVGAAPTAPVFRGFDAEAPDPADFAVPYDASVSLDCPDEVTVECESPDGTVVDVPVALIRPAAAAMVVTVSVDGVVASTLLVPSGTPAGEEGLEVAPTLSDGDHEVSVSVEVGGCTAKTCTTTVHVTDTTAPSVACTVAKPLVGPPLSGSEDVGLAVAVADACDAAPAVTVEVWSNEPAGSDGPTASLGADGTLSVRRWRDSKGDGRVYLVVVRATDDAGNAAAACCAVAVPHAAGKKHVDAAVALREAAAATWTATGAPPTGYVRVLAPTSR